MSHRKERQNIYKQNVNLYGILLLRILTSVPLSLVWSGNEYYRSLQINFNPSSLYNNMANIRILVLKIIEIVLELT
jgi:hypothetical protein